MAVKPYHDEEWLRKLYIDQGLELQEIADRVECSKDTIWRWKNKHGIKKPWRDEEKLRELYVEEQLSMRRIGDKLGCSTQTVKNWLDKHDIETRERSFRQNPGSFGVYVNNWGHVHIHHGYKGEQWSVFVHRLIAVAEHGVDEVKDKHVHHKNGVPWDNRPGNIEPLSQMDHSAEHHHSDMGWRDEGRLIEVYEREGSCRKAAEVLGCSPKTVHNWLQRFGYELSP